MSVLRYPIKFTSLWHFRTHPFQGTAQNDPNVVYVSHQGAISHRLSVIPEQAENTLDRVTADDAVVMTTEMDHHVQDDIHTETELSQVGRDVICKQ